MPIRFYVSWYLGDPVYPAYTRDCSLLLSPTSLSRQWTLRDLSALPARLILDSGGFRYHRSGEKAPTAHELLERQLSILGDTGIPTLLCPLDSPIGWSSVGIVDTDLKIANTLAHASELQRLIQGLRLPSNVEPLGIVQGYDGASLRYCTQELRNLGYRRFGIGSLARVPDSREIARRIAAVFDVAQTPLHLFGIGSPNVVQHLNPEWLASVDSSRPAKAAACNEIFYSRPFRRCGIMNGDGVSISKLPVHRCLAEPLDCMCPICEKDPAAVLRVGRRDHIRSRAVHNYFHLQRAIEDL